MKNTAPISQGIIVIAALFAILSACVAYFLFDFWWLVSLCIGVVVGVITAMLLALGGREPEQGPQQVEAPAAKAAPTPAPPPVEKSAAAPVAAAPAPAPVAQATPSSDDGTPHFLSAARDGGPDELKQIKGVGPKLEKTLHGMGIFHFDQIAAWGPQEQAWIDGNLEGFKGRATRDNWVDQAKTLAGGGATEFSKKVDKGGVY